MERKTTALELSKGQFLEACKLADRLDIANNAEAAFEAAAVVGALRNAMTDDMMTGVFMPLMNAKIGFLTDRDGRAKKGQDPLPFYDKGIVRDAIIDAIMIGLKPTGNQMNIIAGRMYPTKEGYTALLKRLGVKYLIDVSYDKGQNPSFAEIPCKISYEHNGEKNGFTIVATVKKDSCSSHDQMRGKAERRAKKALYEHITGCDFGDADETSSQVIDVDHTEIKPEVKVEAVGQIAGRMPEKPIVKPEQAKSPITGKLL